MTSTDLTPELAELLTRARSLPPQLVRQVADYAEFLGRKHLAQGEVLSGSGHSPDEQIMAQRLAARGDVVPPTESPPPDDDWTEEDLRAVTLESLRRFEAEHPDDDWGVDYSKPGAPECPPQGT